MSAWAVSGCSEKDASDPSETAKEWLGLFLDAVSSHFVSVSQIGFGSMAKATFFQIGKKANASQQAEKNPGRP